MLEEELKFEVADDFTLPEIEGLTAKGRKRLTATYYDTMDLRLARSGATLRYRVGDEQPWTVKLPTSTPGVRHEISVAAPRTRPPVDLVWLVASLTRGAALRRVAVLRSDRHVFTVGGVELADDRVVSGAVAFREIEIELKGGERDLFSTLDRQLRDAGATRSPWESKLVRVLGDAALRPPDPVAPQRARSRSGQRAVLRQAIRAGVQRLLWHDPLVRLGDALPDGDTPVHQMRVGCRRLRSDLRTFGALLEPRWRDRLRQELGWLADLLGEARDAEVLRARLRRTAATDPLAPVDAEAVALIDAELAGRQAQATDHLREGMRTKRYLDLVEALTAATQEQPFVARASLAFDDGGLERKARALRIESPDKRWHRVRILAKRARYAAEAIGDKTRAREYERWQDHLGEHQDAAVAAQAWLGFAAEPGLAVTAGRLFERERARILQVRAEFLETTKRHEKR